MRFGLMIALIFFGVVFMANGSKIRRYDTPNIKQPRRPRTIRDYTTEYWPTALGIGFGKRDGSSEISNLNRREKVLMSLLRNFPQSRFSEWILREIKANPVLAGKLREMIINDGNGQSSIGGQFQPEGTIFVF